MRKFVIDFLYYITQGYSIKKAWKLARITL